MNYDIRVWLENREKYFNFFCTNFKLKIFVQFSKKYYGVIFLSQFLRLHHYGKDRFLCF